MSPPSRSFRPTHPFFNADVSIQPSSSPSGPVARLALRNGTVSSTPLHQLLRACDIVLPMVCSHMFASSIVDASIHAGVPVVPPPAGMACDAARVAVLGYGAAEWLSPPDAKSGGSEYSGIVRGLLANTSIWPVTGMFPPRLVRAKLRAASLAYWAGGQYLEAAFEVSLERSLRMSLDVHEIIQQQQQQQQQRRFHLVPSSTFDCRKISPFRPGGGSNTYVTSPSYCRNTSRECVKHNSIKQVWRLRWCQVLLPPTSANVTTNIP
jgi:hypothetical protein